MEDQDMFFVGIEDPVSVRRELLTCSKTLIDGLKRYEAYAAWNQEKLELVDSLKRVFDEVLVLNKKFRSKMPKVAVPEPKPVFQQKVSLKPVKPKPRSHMDLLEDELTNIERRLESLR